MTDSGTMTCKRCGFANSPGDQFCGSCGAFLEWEGQADDAAAAAGAPATPAAAVQPAPVAPAATPYAAPAPIAVTPVPPIVPTAPADQGLLRCPVCGIANAASRTFCQSCGATLVAAARIGNRSADAIAAAVSAVPATQPVPGASPTMTSRAPAEQKRGGIAGWIIAVVVIGIVAGVAVVAGGTILNGNGPSPIASIAPSLPASSSGIAGASSSASAPAPSSSAATPSASTVAPGRIKLIGAAASSVLGDMPDFKPQNVMDGNAKTSWQEGSDTEKGQWVEVSFAPSLVSAVIFRDGFDASTVLFKSNLRPKDVQVTVDGGAPIAILLQDTPSPQKFSIGPFPGATTLRVTIETTYPSVKTSVSGSPFQDAAISEITVIGVAGS